MIILQNWGEVLVLGEHLLEKWTGDILLRRQKPEWLINAKRRS